LRHARTNGWSAWYGARAAGVDKWEGIGKVEQSVTKLDSSVDKFTTSAVQATKGLDTFGAGAGQVGNALAQFPAAPSGGGFGGGLFSSLFRPSLSPATLSAIAAAPGGLYADGAAFHRGNVIPFARGDVFSSPTFFPMSGGRTGVLAEAGEEAIMPLRRGAD